MIMPPIKLKTILEKTIFFKIFINNHCFSISCAQITHQILLETPSLRYQSILDFKTILLDGCRWYFSAIPTTGIYPFSTGLVLHHTTLGSFAGHVILCGFIPVSNRFIKYLCKNDTFYICASGRCFFYGYYGNVYLFFEFFSKGIGIIGYWYIRGI